MENFVIYYLLITIDYFSLAQTIVLIGVNPCLYRRNLKKQRSKKAKMRVNPVFLRVNSWLI